jgi:hypothetical protein
MPISPEIREALDMKNLNLPPEPKVIAIEVEDLTDWTGDDALRVKVILDESVDEWNFSGEALLRMRAAIHEALLARGISLFPYVFLAKPSELEQDQSQG